MSSRPLYRLFTATAKNFFFASLICTAAGILKIHWKMQWAVTWRVWAMVQFFCCHRQNYICWRRIGYAFILQCIDYHFSKSAWSTVIFWLFSYFSPSSRVIPYFAQVFTSILRYRLKNGMTRWLSPKHPESRVNNTFVFFFECFVPRWSLKHRIFMRRILNRLSKEFDH